MDPLEPIQESLLSNSYSTISSIAFGEMESNKAHSTEKDVFAWLKGKFIDNQSMRTNRIQFHATISIYQHNQSRYVSQPSRTMRFQNGGS